MRLLASIVALALSACGEPELGPDCERCRGTGERCEFSYNCPLGDICNRAGDELFMAERASFSCVTVFCRTDDDCEGGRACGLDRACRPRVCQEDAECDAPNLCLDGRCAPDTRRLEVSGCEVIPLRRTVRSGQLVAVLAVARDGVGQVLPRVRFTWRSSDPLGAVVEADGSVSGGSGGDAELSASVDGVECEGRAIVSSFPPLEAGSVRVVLVAEDGSPIPGATVTLTSTAGALRARTGARGAVLFSRSGNEAIESVIVSDVGRPTLGVLSPGTTDLLLTAPAPVSAERGGFSGSVDLSALPVGDAGFSLVGLSLPRDLLALDPFSLFGEPSLVTIDLPTLGLRRLQTSMPSGVMVSLARSLVTAERRVGDEAEPVRCTTTAPARLGCYFVRAPSSYRQTWTLSGGSALAESIDFFTILGTEHRVDLPMVLDFATHFGWGHDALPLRRVSDALEPANLSARIRLGLRSIVTVPALPAGESFLIVAAETHDGFIPLGMAAAHDADADGRADPTVTPFGPLSDPTQRNTIPVAAAPPHGSIAGAPIALLLLSRSPTDGSFSMRVVRRPRLEPFERIDAPLPAPPRATLDGELASLELDGNAELVRLDFVAAGEPWTVYARASSSLRLPARADDLVAIRSAELVGSYSERWTLGSRPSFEGVAASAQ